MLHILNKTMMVVMMVMLFSQTAAYTNTLFDKVFPVIELVPGGSYEFSPIQNISTGNKDSGYTYSFSSDPALKISGDINSLKVSDVLKKQGIFNLRISLSEKGRTIKTLDIPVIIKNKSRSAKFIYKGESSRQKVSIAGSMNNWKSDIHVLKYNRKSGLYETELLLEYGVYAYKLVVDGQWIIDPDNKNQISDGMGGFNSTIRVTDPERASEPVLYYGKREVSLQNIDLTFYLWNGRPGPADTVLYYNNRLLQHTRDYRVSVANGLLKISIDTIQPDRPSDKIRLMVFDQNSRSFSGIYSYDFQRSGCFDYRDGIIYFVMTDRFHNGNPGNDNPVMDSEITDSANFHGGDFKGLLAKIREGYFTKLGVNILWISPPFQNPDGAYREFEPPHRKFTGYHGYWPINSYSIEPKLGTLQELKDLIKEAHTCNLKILIDYVANHVHQEHPIFKKRKRWFIGDQTPDGKKNIKLFDEYPLTTWFDTFLPKFDFSNPEVRQWLIDQAEWLVHSLGADGLRLDAVKHIPDIFWVELRKKLVEKDRQTPFSRSFLIGETIDSRPKIMSYISESKLDAQFDFSLYWIIRDVFAVGNSTMRNLQQELSDYLKQSEKGLLSAFIGNHDFPRFMSYADGAFFPGSTDEKSRAWVNQPESTSKSNYWKWRAGLTFVMTINGCPLLYYGDEIGLQGAWDPDNRRDMKFGENLTPAEQGNFEFASRLIACRQQTPALRRGGFDTLYIDDDIWVYLRNYFDSNALVIISRKKEPAEVRIELPPFLRAESLKSYRTGKSLEITKKGTLRVPPRTSEIYTDSPD